MTQLLKRLHRYLIPPALDLGYQPYVWLGYLLIYFFNWFFRSPPLAEVIASVVGIAIFLPVYFSTFRRQDGLLVIHILTIILIGVGLSQFNLGASVFFVYAGSFCAQFRKPRNSLFGITLIVSVITLWSWAFQLSSFFYLPAIFFTVLIGLSNLYFIQIAKKNKLLKISQDETQHLAAVAERERIARDLHDVIGHTFSLLTKKAELARKLIPSHPDQAAQEVADIEALARSTLSEVREAVTGIRRRSLADEFIQARYLCRVSDIELSSNLLDTQWQALEFTNVIDATLAYCLREAITNVSKHSHASRVEVTLESLAASIRLQIHDNGSAPSALEFGNGLRGMQERLAAVNGQLQVNNDGQSTHHGFKITIEILTNQEH
ncbi:MAG: sensor histidine kinase [Gammaproteobacteria bacterium]|nr:sensor histidine kinase [Gammaproteobacteria bacterium]